MTYDVIPQNLSIRAMRSSGYKDAAHAVAELIDNSVEAGESVAGRTEVEVICLDKMERVDDRQSLRIHSIGVLDNACGMQPELLRKALQFGFGSRLDPREQKGIGKFGMGLPNASISQCRRVDVWSWRDGETYHTFLDVLAIERGEQTEVPQPTKHALPREWITRFRQDIGESGTFVLWGNLDRITWKRSPAFLRHTEFLIGRIYRYLIHSGDARIRLAAFVDNEGEIDNKYEADVRPNDPLFLMDSSCCPEPYDSMAAFEKFGDEKVDIDFRGKRHTVTITYSLAKQEVRQEGGSSDIGKHVKKDQGVSVVRARRELEMNRSFENAYDPRERWWGVEVSFEPGLDDVFGVTNNKQSATSFKLLDLDADASEEDMTTNAYLESLKESQDPRVAIYKLCNRINATLSTMREQIKRQREGARRRRRGLPGAGSAEGISTKAVRRRQEEGHQGLSDTEESMASQQKEELLAGSLEESGVEHEAAKQLAVEYVQSKLKFLFRRAELPGPMMFDVTSRAGSIIVTLNSRHPIMPNLIELLDNEEDSDDGDSKELTALKLLLSSWARLEDEAGESERGRLEDARLDWGRIARDFFTTMDD